MLSGLIKSAVLLLPLLNAWTAESRVREPVRGPRVVLIVLDAARADRFSSWGYGRPTTPRIDAIARRGTIFLNNFTQATETFASLPLLLSSRYFSLPLFSFDGTQWGLPQLRPPEVTHRYGSRQIFLPQALARAGYRTGLFSQHWAMYGSTPLTDQFDRVRVSHVESSTETASMIAECVSFLREAKNGKAFAYVHLMLPHSPYLEVAAEPEFFRQWDRSTRRRGAAQSEY